MMIRDEWIEKSLRPDFEIDECRMSLFECNICRKQIMGSIKLRCACLSCIYCSFECLQTDHGVHHNTCNRIRNLRRSIDERANTLQEEDSSILSAMFRDGVYFNQYHSCLEHLSNDMKYQKCDDRKNYFSACGELIKELIHEGYRCNGTTRENAMALEFAFDRCRDKLLLSKDPGDLLNVYLITGRLQKLYDLSCHYVRHGCHDLYAYPDRYYRDDHVISKAWMDDITRQDITKSYFKINKEVGNFPMCTANAIGANWLAIVNMFLVKYLLYVNIENLTLINNTFLDNCDCIKLIGEYAGMEKEWMISSIYSKELMVSKRNVYHAQAFEVIHQLSCLEKCCDAHTSTTDTFKLVREFAAEYLPGGITPIIDTALNAGMKWFGLLDEKCYYKEDELVSKVGWAEFIRESEVDHRVIYETNVLPSLTWAVTKINAMAGYNLFGMSIDPSKCLTAFITEAIRACHIDDGSFYKELTHFIEMGEGGFDELGCVELFEGYLDFQAMNKCSFSRGILECMRIERRLAQFNFHNNKGSDEAKSILRMLPGGEEAYTTYEVDECNDGELFCNTKGDVGTLTHLSEWLPDVTKAARALFEADLASNENLAILFGSSGYASYQILKLQEEKQQRNQQKITTFVKRSRVWQEGCIDINSLSGLKIKYLTKADRKQRFEDTRKLAIPMRNSIHLLDPSLEHFVKRFGWDDLEIKSKRAVFGSYCDFLDFDTPTKSQEAKRRRYELDEFSTVKEACRHYFDTATIEEAIWDLVGIPRLLILNGNREVMQKSGWKIFTDREGTAGDRAVQLGNRVAHAPCDGWCTIWREN